MRIAISRKRRGSLLINSMILMVVLLLSGSAFLKWAVGEARLSSYDLAKTQAYYLARKGAISEGLTYLQNRKLTDIRDWGEEFEPTSYASYPDNNHHMFYGKFESSRLIVEMVNLGDGTGFEEIQSGKYNLVFTAAVKMPQDNGVDIVAKSTANIQLQRRSFANYLYLTDCETAPLPGQDPEILDEGEIINFWRLDTLNGRVHSNDFIHMNGRPIFEGPISTTKEEFVLTGGGPPFFAYDPVFNAAPVVFPDSAYSIRNAAMSNGTFFTNDFGELQSKITATISGYVLEQWGVGSPYMPEGDNNPQLIPYGLNTVIFVEGELMLSGEYVRGKSTIASEGNMRLIDNIMYEDFDLGELKIAENSHNILGLVSESNIQVAHTDANGKGNGNATGGQADHSNKHIVITAGMVALGVCFEFENQNDPPWIGDPNGYWWCDPAGDHAGEEDERGVIYIRGAIAMKRRGYVHRGVENCGNTGYGKSYDYDFRLQTDPPPIYLVAEDERGNAIYDITDSWESDPDDENYMRRRPANEY